MATRKDFERTVKALAQGIISVIDEYGLVNDLPDGKNTNLIPNLMKLFNSEFGWAINKGNFELANDMVMEWYTLVFLERADKIFGRDSYVPIGEEGHVAPLLGYMKIIWIRAAQQISQKYYNKLRYVKDVNPIEDESMDDAFNRVMNSPSGNGKIRRMDDDEIKELQDLIHYYEELLPNLKDDDKIKKTKKKLEKVNDKLSHIIDPKVVLHDVEQHLDREFSPVEDIAFDKIMNDLKNIIKDRQNYEVQIQILELLLADFAPSEIAKLLNVSPAKISQRKKALVEDISELAYYYMARGDDTLQEFLNDRLGIKASKKFGNISGKRIQEEDINVLARQANILSIFVAPQN